MVLGASPAQESFNVVQSAVWTELLAVGPSILSRLAFLSSLRDSKGQHYRHALLAPRFPETEIDQALRTAHEQSFREWLALSLEQQQTDLQRHLATLGMPQEVVLDQWEWLEPYRKLMPASIESHERNLYLSDLRVMLVLLRSEPGVGPARLAPPATAAGVDWRIAQVQRWVEERCGDAHLTLGALSKPLRCSERTLGRVFYRELGLPYRDYLRGVRLRRAATLLGDLTQTVQQVAAAVGYSDATNFTHDFTFHFGICPKRFRQCRR